MHSELHRNPAHRPTQPQRRALACAIVALLAPAFSAAQTTPATDAADAKKDAPAAAATPGTVDLSAVVVTASAGGKSRLRSSVSTSAIGSEAIQESAPRSTAEIFRNIPGVRSESTGGEGNANIAVRGLPVAAGGAKFLQLQEDGLPVMEFGDIAFGNADIFLRSDWSLDRIEAVRGGSASTFASNSPGGVINFVSNTGEIAGGAIGLTTGLDYSSNRVDFRYGAPFGNGWRYHVAGFYRSGDGVRDAGYTAEKGGQIKANLTKEFDGGFARIYLKYLNDKAIGYLPVPTRASGTNDNPDLGPIRGFDPATDTLHSRYFLSDIGLDGQNRRRRTDIADGMHPKSLAIGAEVEYHFADTWRINEKFRYADTDGGFVSPFPASIGSAASVAASIGGAGSTLRYANGPNAGKAFTGTAVQTNLFNVDINDFGNYANDLKLTKTFALDGDDAFDVSVGYYAARQNIDMDWVWNSYVQELRGGGESALLDVINAGGINQSQGGLFAYGVPTFGNCCQRSYNTKYKIGAPYLSLALSAGRWDIDASVRRDNGDASGNYAASVQVANVDVDGNGVITPNEVSVSQINNAKSRPVDYSWGYTSYSLGANYLFTDDVAGFARISRGGRANADRLLFGVVQADGSVRAADAVDLVNQYEAGLKWRSDRVSVFATAFYAKTEEQNFEATNQRFLDRVYKAHGVELEASWRAGDHFTVNGGLTWTDAEISEDAITPTNVGNIPRRQAKVTYQLTPAWRTQDWTLGANIIGTTDSFAQDNNKLVMPGFTQVNLFADYRFAERWVASLNVNNAFDTFGITESEEGSIVAGTENIIRARSIPGRTSTVSLRYEF
jgi:outer membrane receptor protein involved in Fe transport